VQLATTTTNSGEESAVLADKIHAETNHEINHIHNKNQKETKENQNILIEINKQLEKFNNQFTNLENRLKTLEINTNKSTYKQKTIDRKPKTNTTPNENQNGLCWYHEKYGNQAYRCQSPCNFNNLNTNSHYPQHQG